MAESYFYESHAVVEFTENTVQRCAMNNEGRGWYTHLVTTGVVTRVKTHVPIEKVAHTVQTCCTLLQRSTGATFARRYNQLGIYVFQIPAERLAMQFPLQLHPVLNTETRETVLLIQLTCADAF